MWMENPVFSNELNSEREPIRFQVRLIVSNGGDPAESTLRPQVAGRFNIE
jgi:hypothetical protein